MVLFDNPGNNLFFKTYMTYANKYPELDEMGVGRFKKIGKVLAESSLKPPREWRAENTILGTQLMPQFVDGFYVNRFKRLNSSNINLNI